MFFSIRKSKKERTLTKKGKVSDKKPVFTAGKLIFLELQCPYCHSMISMTIDREMAENRDRLPISLKCPFCGEYSKIRYKKLYLLDTLEEDI